MTGMGELCPDLSRLLGARGSIVAVDISQSMCRVASSKRFDYPVKVIQADVLNYEFEPASADVVVSSFGLKTFSREQTEILAGIVARVLKPGGVFSLIEISVPRWPWLRWPYMFYINRLIPYIGLLFLGNPDNYRQLGVYTAAFQNCSEAARLFESAGLQTQLHSFFFGCATGITGRKPL
jgi:demethylmenaquinone methyltransferase/2-methoxy-6-polyprenyl-1,4-benzoquinol methylase